MIAYFAGVFAGLSWYNARLTQSGLEKLFCPPSDVTLSEQQLIGSMESYTSKPENAHLLDGPTGPLMLTALERDYPCPAAR